MWVRWQEPCSARGQPTLQPRQAPAPLTQLQNPVPNAVFQSRPRSPRCPGMAGVTLRNQIGLPALLGHFRRPRAAHVTWVNDREDQVISLLSFQPI